MLPQEFLGGVGNELESCLCSVLLLETEAMRKPQKFRMQQHFLKDENSQMAQLPFRMQQISNTDLVHQIEGIGDSQLNESNLFLGL